MVIDNFILNLDESDRTYPEQEALLRAAKIELVKTLKIKPKYVKEE
jgi:hypothetical protein